ncbi:MAG: DUF488 family protein, N3 subclade [Planctomycetota bacterium]|jgi:hypothetical protein
MVKTKHVYDPPEISDGDRILLSRGWPRPRTREELAITDWLKILTPSKDLYEDWKGIFLLALTFPYNFTLSILAILPILTLKCNNFP